MVNVRDERLWSSGPSAPCWHRRAYGDAYSVFNALTDPANGGYARIRHGPAGSEPGPYQAGYR